MVVRTGLVPEPRDFLPRILVDCRKARIPLRRGMHVRDLDPVGDAEALRVDFRAADARRYQSRRAAMRRHAQSRARSSNDVVTTAPAA